MKSIASRTALAIFCLLSHFCLLLQSAPAQDVTKKSKFTIGDTVEFQSQVLAENRILNIYLPANYPDHPDKKYPVIYLLDGSVDEDFIHVAGLVQFGSFPWIKMIPETIVVGIANVDRKRDFTFPTKNEQDKQDFPTSGGSARFITMLKTEIQPLIEKNYRTNNETTVIGQSLGGLLATEILYTKPTTFDNYIIISPSLWWDDSSLLNSRPQPLPDGTSIFVGVGKEGEEMEQIARALHGKIENNNTKNIRLWFQHFPELDHGDTLHLAVYGAFKKIFIEKQ